MCRLLTSSPLRPIPKARVKMADVDEWWTGYTIALPGFAGSLLSVLYFGAGLWAVLSVLARRFPMSIPVSARPFTISCLGYGLVMLASSIANDGAGGVVPGLGAGAAFFFVPFLISRYRHSSPDRAIEMLCAFAPVGAVLGFLAAARQGLLPGLAIEGGAGNASVFGLVGAILGALSLANVVSPLKLARIMAFIGFAAGMAMVFYSQTRILYPVALLAPLILGLSARASGIKLRHSRWGTLALIGAVGIALFWNRIGNDVADTRADFAVSADFNGATSLGIRLALWDAAIPSIAVRPILGHGIVHKMDGVYRGLPDELSYIRVTHSHNIWIDSALSAGVFGVGSILALFLSPLIMLTRRPASHPEFLRNHVIIATVLICLLNGLMNTLFTHDIMTVMFLLPLIVAASGSRK
jgi:O-antigen ligase